MNNIAIHNSALIFLGAGFGGVFRYWVSTSVYALFGNEFPYGTLVVNISGCLLMGLLSVFILERELSAGPQFRALLLIGLLGGYTTFSSFSMETINLLENGQLLSGVLNIILSVGLCILATGIGVIGAKLL